MLCPEYSRTLESSIQGSGLLRTVGRNFHWLMTALLSFGMAPAFKIAHIPFRFDWSHYVAAYWISLALQSIFVATLLYAVQFPSEFWFNLRHCGRPADPVAPLAAILGPAIYFFIGLIICFAYNDVIASLRFDGSADLALSHIDRWLLGGRSISEAAQRVSPLGLNCMRFIYFAMFPQIGSCLLMVALREGKKEAMRFISAIMTAYYIGLIGFFFVPAAGPYYLSAGNPLGRSGLDTGELGFARVLNSFRVHHSISMVSTDYFIAFPCLHIAQPIIVLWFLRKWQYIVLMLGIFDLLLVPSILLLQQHYAVDLVGGVALALLAISMVKDFPICATSPSQAS